MSVLRVNWDPDAKQLRQFGIGLFIFGAIVAGIAYWKGNPEAARRIFAVLAALGGVTLAAPPAGRLVYKGWMCAAFVIGTVISTLVLVLIYFGIVTPLALFFKLRGRDELRLARSGATYWVPLSLPEDKRSWERLF